MQTSIYGRDRGWTTIADDEWNDDTIFHPDTKAGRPNPFPTNAPHVDNSEPEEDVDGDASYGQCHMDLVILEGTGLNQVYGSWIDGKLLIPGRSDPYVVCKADTGQILTVTKPLNSRSKSTDHAVWNHYAGVPYQRGQALIFEIHDTETEVESIEYDDVIAWAVLEAKRIQPGVHDLQLIDKEGNEGLLKVGVVSTPTRPLHDQELVLMVSSAKRLHNPYGDVFGGLKASAYCTCRVAGKEDKLTFTTPTVKHDLSPKWNYPSVLKFKNFDGCDALIFEVYNDTFDKSEHQLLGVGVVQPQDIGVGVHRIPLRDLEGWPLSEGGELKVNIFSVPKLLRNVAKALEKDRLKMQEEVFPDVYSGMYAEPHSDAYPDDNALPQDSEAPLDDQVPAEDMSPGELEAIQQQKQAAKTERRRVKEERRRLRAEALAQAGGSDEELLRLREEVAALRAQQDQDPDSSAEQKHATVLKQHALLNGLQMQQQLLSEARRNQLQGSPPMSPWPKPEVSTLGGPCAGPYLAGAPGAFPAPEPACQPAAKQCSPEQAAAHQQPVAAPTSELAPRTDLQQSLGELQHVISTLGTGFMLS